MDNPLCEACESTCHECSTKDEVENDNNKKIHYNTIQYNTIQKLDLIIKRDREHKEITREKENLKIRSQQY